MNRVLCAGAVAGLILAGSCVQPRAAGTVVIPLDDLRRLLAEQDEEGQGSVADEPGGVGLDAVAEEDRRQADEVLRRELTDLKQRLDAVDTALEARLAAPVAHASRAPATDSTSTCTCRWRLEPA